MFSVTLSRLFFMAFFILDFAFIPGLWFLFPCQKTKNTFFFKRMNIEILKKA